MTRRMTIVERDPWQALIAPDEIPFSVMEPMFGPGSSLYPVTVVLGCAGGVGATLQMLNHGIVTGALFLFVGIQYEKTHRRLIADLGGLANRWPLYTAFFGVFVRAQFCAARNDPCSNRTRWRR